jgi:serine/threonine-protein kinase HipA
MSDRICLFCGKPLVNSSNDAYWHDTCINSFFGELEIPELNITENNIKTFGASNIIDGNIVSGVQKKFSLEHKSKRKKKTLMVDKYIIKPHENKCPLLNIYEWIGNRLAALCGFKVVESGLVLTKDKNYAYITRRVDRKAINNQITKLPMEDFCQLSQMRVENKYDGSYEKAYKTVIKKYSESKMFDTIEYFRIIFFSYIIGNTDMHLKNLSLLKENKFYMLSPFYDIVPVMMVVNQLEIALTINGKRKNITKNDFITFGKSISLDERLIKVSMNSILSKLDKMIDFINLTPLIKEEKERFINFLKERVRSFI